MKNTKILLAITLFFGTSNAGSQLSSSQNNRDYKTTFLHKLVERCHIDRIKANFLQAFERYGIDPAKSIKIFLAVGLFIWIINVHGAAWFVNHSNCDDKATDLHEMAKRCHIGRVKGDLATIFDHYGIDPFIKNKDQLTAREVANCLFEQTGKPYCEHMTEELELYEKRYQEIMQQK